MKKGRVPKVARQWVNFIFLSILLIGVGIFAWKSSQVKVFEVPENHVVVSAHKPFFSLPWSKPKYTVKRAGRYPLPKGSEEKIVCLPVGSQDFEFEGVLDSSTKYQSLASMVGIGNKAFVKVYGTLSLFIDEAGIQSLVRDKSQDYSGYLSDSLTAAFNANVKFVEDYENFKRVTKESLSVTLEKEYHVKVEALEFIEIEKLEEVSNPRLSVNFISGQLVEAKILEQMPKEGYLGIIIALILTLFFYGFVRVFLSELLALILYFPLQALGFDSFRIYEPGHYGTSRRRRGYNSSAADIAGAALDAGMSVSDYISAHHVSSDAGDLISGAGDLLSNVDGVSEAAGGVLDVFGGIFEIF